MTHLTKDDTTMLAAPFRPRAAAAAAALACTLAAWPAAQAQTVTPANPANPATAPATAPSAAQAAAAIHLPAQPLAHSLAALAQRSGASLAYAPELVAGKQAAAVQGAPGVGAALAQMLRGTGLQARQQGQTWTIQPAPTPAQAAAASSAGDAQTLPAVTVQAAPETATGPVLGYAARRSATATKTDTPLVETPQSISVIGAEEIEAKGMREVLDTLGYTPGVFPRMWGHDGRGYEYMMLRGFDDIEAQNFLDGIAQMGFLDIGAQTEVYGMERIEVLRGPASATFGRADVGGIVHRVSKRPTLDEPVREVQAQLGNYRQRQLAFDYGGKLGEQAAYRLVGLARQGRTQDRYPTGEWDTSKRQYFAPSLLWQPSAATRLTLLASVLRHDVSDDVGYMADGNGQLTPTREGDPRYSRIKQNTWSLGYELRHDFNVQWGLRQNFRHAKRDADKHHIRSSLQDDGHTLTRTAVHGFGDLTQTSLDTYVEGRLQTGAVRHQLIAGVDFTQARATEYEKTGPAPDLDLYNPVYRPITPPSVVDDIAGPNKVRALGLYAQNQMRLGEQWLLTLSGRHDTAKGEDASSSRGQRQSRTDRAFTGRAALTWLAPGGWAPYVSYGTSFLPAFGAYDAFDAKPTTGKQWELGVKYQPPGQSLLLTAAVYDLRKRNITVSNPITNRDEQVGAMRSRGLELEAKGRPLPALPGLHATAAYSYNDVKGLAGSTWRVQAGKAPIQVPKHMASLWLDYRLAEGGLRGLHLGLGARHVGRRWDDAANTRAQPGYTLVDASLRYDLGANWRLALNVNNLFNKKYFASNAFDGWWRGEQRTVTATATYRW
ncbi:TonB-dependent siderophore receptor [Vandammella animalimorsus]|uniref:TonB-dependent siderophore receptor n=1 Tax=Vandammella animalimorsus TaxID=2029117 RepID=A0A2A2ASH5_9BURK|nr:TonB-dependent siderophore receptor [Vandammella animalimorsus]PAT40707.1 TonB-dependent siderophore receptor [Vandammella animalimorsus]